MVLDLSMLYLTIPLAAGIILGYLLREKKRANLGKVTFGIILVLIFSLGFTIGSNNELLNSIPRVGLGALGISVFAIAFSVLFAVLIRRKLRI